MPCLPIFQLRGASGQCGPGLSSFPGFLVVVCRHPTGHFWWELVCCEVCTYTLEQKYYMRIYVYVYVYTPSGFVPTILLGEGWRLFILASQQTTNVIGI